MHIESLSRCQKCTPLEGMFTHILGAEWGSDAFIQIGFFGVGNPNQLPLGRLGILHVVAE